MSVEEKYQYIQRLREPIESLHKCRAYHIETALVEEELGNETTTWQRSVEVFTMVGHPDCQLCYAWTETATIGSRERFFCFLAGFPVDSPMTAVQARRNQQRGSGP